MFYLLSQYPLRHYIIGLKLFLRILDMKENVLLPVNLLIFIYPNKTYNFLEGE